MKPILLLLFTTALHTAFAQPSAESAHNTGIEYQPLFSSADGRNVACYRIPALLTAPNGDLLAAIDERVPSCADLKANRDINIVMRRSTDQGKSWTAIETVVDYPPGQSASDPSMIIDAVTGEIFLFFNFMDLDREKDVYYLKVVKSGDNGKSWSEPVDITSQISRPEWHADFKFITSGRGIQTSDGKLLHTLVHLEEGVYLFGSDDHGRSWYLISTPISPADESKVVERADGSWMVNSRVNKAGYRFVHTSLDKGKNWHSVPDTTLTDPGCNASIIRHTTDSGKDILLFSNPDSRDERTNLVVRSSDDGGKSWTAGKTIYQGSAAYSSMSVLSNGDIGLFFEKDNYQENVFVRFSLEWLQEGQDKKGR